MLFVFTVLGLGIGVALTYWIDQMRSYQFTKEKGLVRNESVEDAVRKTIW